MRGIYRAGDSISSFDGALTVVVYAKGKHMGMIFVGELRAAHLLVTGTQLLVRPDSLLLSHTIQAARGKDTWEKCCT